jgi:hypothetical protein
MKLPDKFQCMKCGVVVNREMVLYPPSAQEKAKEMPCTCGATQWKAAAK